MTQTNKIALTLILLAVATYYLDIGLKIDCENSISLAIFTAGTTLLNLGARK
jgi:hypothetical protein